MAQLPSPQPLRVAPGHVPSAASGSQNPRSPTSIRSTGRRFITVNPDPSSSSSPGSVDHGHASALRPSENFLPDPRNNGITPPVNIHAPLNAFSPAPTVMNVDPGAPTLGVAGEDDMRAQQAMEDAERDRKANEPSVAGLARKATIKGGKRFIGGFMPWIKGLAGPRPEHIPKHEMVGPHAGMVSMSMRETTTAHSDSRSGHSPPSSFQPLPSIRIESPSSHTATPFIPPAPPSIHSQHSPPAGHIPAREPSPTLEGSTLLGHGPTLPPVPLRPASTQYVDPATLALPDSPEYQPLPHAADYAKMAANPEKSEAKTASLAAKSPTAARLHRFWKTIDDLPWIGMERITADYYPSRVDVEGKPWRFGSYEKRKPPPIFSPTHPHGGRLPNEELRSPTFGYHRTSRYDFGIRRSQFSRMKLGRSKSRSALNSWYDGKSQKSTKELDLLSSGDEVEPFPTAIAPSLQTAMMVGHTPVSMAPVPLYEQRIVDGKPVDVDIDQERAFYQDFDHAEGAELGRRAVLAANGYQVPMNQAASQAASVLSHGHSAGVLSPSSTVRSPPPTHKPSSHSRSRSRDHGSQPHPVYATKTPKAPAHGYTTSHSRSYSVDYYVQPVVPEYVPPAPTAPSVVSTRTGSIQVGEPKKPKARSHSRSRSTPHPVVPAPAYYSTTTPMHARSPSYDGHHHYQGLSRGESTSSRRRERAAMPVPF